MISIPASILDEKEIDGLHLRYQEAIRQTILSTYQLEHGFKTALEKADLGQKALAPDLCCRYFIAQFRHINTLQTSGCEWFVDLSEPINIRVIDPIDSVADDYFSKADELNTRGAQLSVPIYNSEVVAETIDKIKHALTLLRPVEQTAVCSKLLRSISVFAGTEATATSGVMSLAPGRIYIREVTEPYPEFYYLDMMVHELSHLYCNVITALFPPISDPTKRFFSVAKNTERPILGIYNAIFVLYRLIKLYPILKPMLKETEQPLPENVRYDDYLYCRFFHIPFHYDFRLTLYRMKFKIASQELLESDGLTPAGRALLLMMQAEIDTSKKVFYDR